MTEALKLFRMTFSTILFCVGVALLIHSSRAYSEIMANIRTSYKDHEIYQQYNADDVDRVSYSELIATLCNNPEYDISIDGVAINKSSFDPENIKSYGIQEIGYKKTYVYDNNGNIIRIKYTAISG